MSASWRLLWKLSLTHRQWIMSSPSVFSEEERQFSKLCKTFTTLQISLVTIPFALGRATGTNSPEGGAVSTSEIIIHDLQWLLQISLISFLLQTPNRKQAKLSAIRDLKLPRYWFFFYKKFSLLTSFCVRLGIIQTQNWRTNYINSKPRLSVTRLKSNFSLIF